jgi:hypothetical protein
MWFSYSEDFVARFAEGDTTMWFSYSEDFVYIEKFTYHMQWNPYICRLQSTSLFGCCW